MDWIGTWKNQFGSAVEITNDADGKIEGIFSTALQDSGFFGKRLSISGIHLGDCISFSFADSTRVGDMLCSFSGLLRDGKIETMWHVIADGQGVGGISQGEVKKRSWPHAVTTNADTWSRAD